MLLNKSVPQIPDNFPKFGNALSRSFGRLLLVMFRWNIVGQYPDTNRIVIAVAPHTSNWDFVIGLVCKIAMGFRAHWLGKHSIFIWPFKGLLVGLGGIPVVRHAASDMVSQVADRYNSGGPLMLAIAPEGTRKKTEKLKTGFIRIAIEANVPIWLLAFDYQKRQLILGDVYYPTGDVDRDELFVREYFSQFQGKHPEQYCRAESSK